MLPAGGRAGATRGKGERFMFRRAMTAAIWATAIVAGGCGHVHVDLGNLDAVASAELGEPGEVNLDFFYDRLAPYGDWYEDPTYGWVWQPTGVPVGWRPYTYGHWAYTDDYGWTWVSSWPWGWGPFHYGRWTDLDDRGWAWIPGHHWGPAWVAWRSGGGYVGWAPLPPRVRCREGHGLELNGVDLDRLPHRDWVFLHDRDFLEPVHEHEILPFRNEGLFGETHGHTKFRVEHGHVFDESLPIERMERSIGHAIPRMRVHNARSAEAMRMPREHAGELRVFRPRISEHAPAVRPPGRQEFARRQAGELRSLHERQQAERENMMARHEAERRAHPERLRETQPRQERELHFMQGEHQRQEHMMQLRHERERSPGRSEARPPERREGRDGGEHRERRD